MSAALRDDAFGEHEADAEVGEVGRRRHHHGVGHGVDQQGDRHLLGELPGDRRAVARFVDGDALVGTRAQRGARVDDIGGIGHSGHSRHCEAIMARETYTT